MFDASPSFGAYAAEPLSISEIDTHPDCDRIWATIHAMRSEAKEEIQRNEDESACVLSDAKDDATKAERENCLDEIRRWSKNVLDGWDTGAHDLDWLTDQIATVDDAL